MPSKVLPATYPTGLAAINPNLNPNVPAIGRAAVTPPPIKVPSAPNFIFCLKSSAALADPVNISPL